MQPRNPESWRLGEILIQKGWINWDQLEEALSIQQKTKSLTDNSKPGTGPSSAGNVLQLGEILIKNGWLHWDHLNSALELQRQTGNRIGTVLLEKKYVSSKDLHHGIAIQFGKPFVDFSTIRIPPEVVHLVPRKAVYESHTIPLIRKEQTLLIAVADPMDVEPERYIQKILTDFDIRTAVACPEDISHAIQEYYGIEGA